MGKHGIELTVPREQWEIALKRGEQLAKLHFDTMESLALFAAKCWVCGVNDCKDSLEYTLKAPHEND